MTLNILRTSGISVVPAPIVNVAAAPTCTSFSRINAMFPDVSSESTLIEVAAPTNKVLEALKI